MWAANFLNIDQNNLDFWRKRAAVGVGTTKTLTVVQWCYRVKLLSLHKQSLAECRQTDNNNQVLFWSDIKLSFDLPPATYVILTCESDSIYLVVISLIK